MSDEAREGWDRAVRDIKARLSTIQPDETWFTHREIREALNIIRALPNPYRKEADRG